MEVSKASLSPSRIAAPKGARAASPEAEDDDATAAAPGVGGGGGAAAADSPAVAPPPPPRPGVEVGESLEEREGVCLLGSSGAGAIEDMISIEPKERGGQSAKVQRRDMTMVREPCKETSRFHAPRPGRN